MIGINELFKRIKNVHTKEVFIRTAVQESIKKGIGVEVPLESISFSGTTVLIKADQTLRSAIFIKKPSIVNEINQKQTLRKIEDIR